MKPVSSFQGLNNVIDPLRQGLSWLVQADNIDITNTGAIKKRKGYSLALAGSITGAYSTLNFARCYIVNDGVLLAMTSPTTAVTLQSGLNSAPMYFTEVNEQVFFSNGVDSGIIQPDNAVLPWRGSLLKDTKFLNVDGKDVDPLFDPLPLGVDVIQHWRARIYASQHMAAENQSIVWFSQPLGFHLFDLDDDFLLLPGRVLMLAPHDSALIIGTDAAIYAYDGQRMDQIAPYGVVPGQTWSEDEKQIIFWAQRGLCTALPFRNLTPQVSVAPGVRAGGALVHDGGSKRYLVALQQGNSAFNPL